MMHRFNVYFHMTDDIDISVIVESELDGESHVLNEAKRKLDDGGFTILSDFERLYLIDHLESIG